MPISDVNEDVLSDLFCAFQDLPWYKKWLYPRSVSASLIQYQNKKSLSFVQAAAIHEACSKLWFWQRWLFPFLNRFATRSQLYSSISTLKTGGLLEEANFEAVIACKKPDEMAKMLIVLKDADLLTSTNRDAVTLKEDLNPLNEALTSMKTENLLGQEDGQANFNVVLNHSDPMTVVNILKNLQAANLLAGEQGQRNRDAVTSNKDLNALDKALTSMNTENLLGQEDSQSNFEAVCICKKPDELVKILSILKNAGILTPANREAAKACRNLHALISSVEKLKENRLLWNDEDSQANIEAVCTCKHPNKMAMMLIVLKEAVLLTLANREAVKACQHTGKLLTAVEILKNNSLWNDENKQANFALVCDSPNPVEMANALSILSFNKLLTHANERAVAEHKDMSTLLSVLRTIANDRVVDQITFDTILQHQNLGYLNIALKVWHDYEPEKLFNNPYNRKYIDTAIFKSPISDCFS